MPDISVNVVSTSYARPSRSRIAVQQAASLLARRSGVVVTFTDLPELGWPGYPTEPSSAARSAIAAFEAADAIVLGVPVHNWGPAASTMAFLAHVLDPKSGRRFRPVLVIGGAGSTRSHLALDGVVRTLQSEVDGVIVGKPIIVAGDDADRAMGVLRPEISTRIDEAVSALLVIATAQVGA